MKTLLINKFLYPKGGDAVCTLDTGALLKTHGHEVAFWGMSHPENADFPYAEYFVDNVDYGVSGGIKGRLRMAANLLYSLEAKRKVAKVIDQMRPDIVHLHNFAHQISPSILHVFKKQKVPVVMTMHDYKLVCPAYTMLVQDNVCERCKGGRYYQCFNNRCTKNSRFKSLLNTVEMYLHHRFLHIYDLIDVFISPSRFLKEKVEEMGFRGQVVHLPNFVKIEEFEPSYEPQEKSIVYVGRLSREKGIPALIEAVKGLDATLKIIGDGPLKESLEEDVQRQKIKNIEFLGYKSSKELKSEIKKSMFFVLPSECYENNPRSVIEAFALGKPVIGARIGGIPELVKDKETGLTFESGNIGDLRDKINHMLNNPEKVSEMGRNGREFVEKEFNAEKHYERLMPIYESVMKA